MSRKPVWVTLPLVVVVLVVTIATRWKPWVPFLKLDGIGVTRGMINPKRVHFVREERGDPAPEVEAALCQVFIRMPTIRRAYLIEADFETGKNVACVIEFSDSKAIGELPDVVLTCKGSINKILAAKRFSLDFLPLNSLPEKPTPNIRPFYQH